MTILQRVIAYAILCYGIFFGILVCKKAWKNRKQQTAAERGHFPGTALSQFVVYFLSTMGFPDFVMNTLILTETRWTDSEDIPPTLVAASVTPGAVIAFSYLRDGQRLDTITMVACMIAIGAGAYAGAHVMLNLSGQLVRRIMMIAMTGSMVALIVKIIVTGGTTGTDTSLTILKLCIVLPIVFCLGFLNMFGVPMKPASTALFLLAGLSPMTTLTLMLVIGFISPMSGSIQVMKSGRYHRKLALSSVIFGTIGAVLGTFVTFSLNAMLLNIILLCIMGFTVLVLARKK